MKKIVVLISGNGSNLQALIDNAATGVLDVEIAAVVSNRADAYGLTRARDAGIGTEMRCLPTAEAGMGSTSSSRAWSPPTHRISSC